MDFLQILVHQHAKTIVQLQDLQCEVEKLKDFRSSFISSITGELTKASAGPSHSHSSSSTHLHHLPSNKQDVWTSSPNKLIDSGFSTETKESNNQKEDEDPLYSLLDLIQTKVSNSTTLNSTSNNVAASCSTCTCNKPVNNGTKSSANNLGKLDKILGFKDGGFGAANNHAFVDKSLIGVILREIDVLELQRQLIFAAVKIKALESQNSSGNDLEERNPNRLLSKYHALSHENEQLRFKLKEQEIQLEGTKAKLRILERNGLNPLSSFKSSIGPSIVSVPPEPYPRVHRKGQIVNGNNSNLYHSNKSPIIIPTPIRLPPDEDPNSNSNSHLVIRNTSNSHHNNNNPSHHSLSPSSISSTSVSPSPSANLRGPSFLPHSSPSFTSASHQNPKLITPQPQGYSNLSNYHATPSNNLRSSSTEKQLVENGKLINETKGSLNELCNNNKSSNVTNDSRKNSTVNNNHHLLSQEESSNALVKSIQQKSSIELMKQPGRSFSRIPTRPQTPRKNLIPATTSAGALGNVSISPPTSQPISSSKSPSSSISSKSSIPIPITRLKRNNSANHGVNNSTTNANRKTGLWGWFTAS